MDKHVISRQNRNCFQSNPVSLNTIRYPGIHTHHHCKLECIMKKQQKLLNYLDRPLTEIYVGRGRCALYTWSVFCRSDRAARGSSTESRSGRRTLRPHSPPSVGSVKTINI